MSEWAPRPRRPVNMTGGIFDYTEDQSIVIKSQTPTQRQQALGITPMTRSAHPALRPAEGPKLVLNDFEAIKKSAPTTQDRVDAIMKSYRRATDLVKAYVNS